MGHDSCVILDHAQKRPLLSGAWGGKIPKASKTYCKPENERTNIMLFTIAVILIILWLLGLITSYTLGGFIHVLFVIAIIIILVRVIQGRKIL